MKFIENFQPQLTIASPGRINLIGEHTDYNLGYVLPTAIANKIVFKLAKNNSKSQCNVYSVGYEGFSFDLNAVCKSASEWENYVLGVLSEILKLTNKVEGFDCIIESNLPLGAGLSSSAAMECGMAFGLNELFDLGLSKNTIVALSQRAEHNYVGTQCGIMDQFASVMSKEGHVILLDCKSLDYRHIPLDLQPYKIIMMNTKVSHNLATSAYNTRKRECEEGLTIIKTKWPKINSLRDVTLDMIEDAKDKLTQTVYNRCCYIINENNRVLEMAKALSEKKLKTVGKLLYEAHKGLSERYEVSCVESDFLVDFSKNYDGVLGARQVGGGFGGCVLHIVHENIATKYKQDCIEAYKKKFNLDLEVFEVKPTGGTHII